MGPFSCRISNKAYHADKAVGSSSLKRVLRSPAHYKYDLENPTPPTPEMIFGTHVHSAVLEPDTFFPNVARMPDYKGPGCVQKRLDHAAAHPDKHFVDPDDMARIEGIVESIKRHKTASALLNRGQAEQSYFATDETTGLAIKARPDFLTDQNVILDLKTTVDASPEGFPREAVNYKYLLSAAYYLDIVSTVLGERLDNFVLIAVEKKEPYAVATYVLDPEAIAYGRRQYQKALVVLNEATRSGRWDAYPDQLNSLVLPNYLMKE